MISVDHVPPLSLTHHPPLSNMDCYLHPHLSSLCESSIKDPSVNMCKLGLFFFFTLFSPDRHFMWSLSNTSKASHYPHQRKICHIKGVCRLHQSENYCPTSKGKTLKGK